MPEPIDLTTPEWSVSAVKPGPAGTVEVVAAVAAAMAELPAIGKDSKAAKEQGGYAYRGIEAITGHLQALLAKHQVLTIPRAEILATVPSPGMNQGWTDVTMRVEWIVAGADGSSFTAVTNGIGRDKSDKGANKAQTQAHKYLLLPLFCIADRKDDADGDSYEDGRVDTSNTVEEVNLTLVTKVAGRVFKQAGEDAPEGRKTLARDRLRHAVIWAATKGRTASLKDCTQDDLAAVYARLKHIETGSVTFTHDAADGGYVTFTPQEGPERTISWSDIEPAPTPDDDGAEGALTAFEQQAEAMAAATPEVTE